MEPPLQLKRSALWQSIKGTRSKDDLYTKHKDNYGKYNIVSILEGQLIGLRLRQEHRKRKLFEKCDASFVDDREQDVRSILDSLKFLSTRH